MVIKEISNEFVEYDYSLNPLSIEGIVQRGSLLLSTTRGQLPLDREYGLDPKMVDKPSNTILPGLKVDIRKQFKRYIPEMELLEVILDGMDAEGKMIIRCKVSIDDR